MAYMDSGCQYAACAASLQAGAATAARTRRVPSRLLAGRRGLTGRAAGSGPGAGKESATALTTYETYRALPSPQQPYGDYDYALVAEIIRAAEAAVSRAYKKGQGKLPAGDGCVSGWGGGGAALRAAVARPPWWL